MYTLATSGQYCHYLQFSHQSRQSHLHTGVIFCPPLVKESHVHILVVAPPAHVHMKCQHLLYIRRQTQDSVNHTKRPPICQQSQTRCMRLWLMFVFQQHLGMHPASMQNRTRIKSAGKLINPQTLAFPLFLPPHPLYCQQDTHMYINTTKSYVPSHLLLPQTNRARLHIDPTYDDVSTSHIPRSRSPSGLRSPRAPSPARAPSPRPRQNCQMSISPTQGQFIDPMQMSILKQMLQQMQEYLQPECTKVPYKPSSNTHLQPESGKVYVASNMHFVFIYMMQYGNNDGNVQTSTQKIP